MKKSILGLLVVAGLAVSGISKAGIVLSDWQTAGDNMVIRDTGTNISYLSLAATDGMTYDAVASLLSTTYAGWRFASNTQVESIMTTMFPGANLEVQFKDQRSGLLWEQVNEFRGIFGDNASSLADHNGTYYDENGFLRVAGVYVNEGGNYTRLVGLNSTRSAICSNVTVASLHSTNGSTGIWLVDTGGVEHVSSLCPQGSTSYTGIAATITERVDPPTFNVSSPLSLGGIGLLCLSGLMRKKKRA